MTEKERQNYQQEYFGNGSQIEIDQGTISETHEEVRKATSPTAMFLKKVAENLTRKESKKYFGKRSISQIEHPSANTVSRV